MTIDKIKNSVQEVYYIIKDIEMYGQDAPCGLDHAIECLKDVLNEIDKSKLSVGEKDFIVIVDEICEGTNSAYLVNANDKNEAKDSVIKSYTAFWEMPTINFLEKYKAIVFQNDEIIMM